MQLVLDHIVPIPLKEELGHRPSDVWNTPLTLDSRERVFIKAPSGSGKTTLIHMLYGVRTDFEGSVNWNGKNTKNLTDEDWADLRKNRLSVVFQDLRLFPALTALENIEIKRHLDAAVSPQQVHEWLECAGLGHRKHRPASSLSYGEQQRVAILRALVQPFYWLLLDEPFSHLDAANKDVMRSLVLEIADTRGAGILLADLDDNAHFPYHKTLVL